MQPFSYRARPWEVKGQELRKLAGAKLNDLLDPRALAPRVGLLVVEAADALASFSAEDRDHLLKVAKDEWSGGVMPKPLPDGMRICILNPTHGQGRTKITLMEEISHVYLGHTATALRSLANGLRVRDYNSAQELEAYGVGAAALLPWVTLFHEVNGGATVEDLADMYEVTTDLIAYRLKITGAYNLFRSRQAKRFRKAAGSS